MGYTHYWHVKPVLDKDVFKNFANDVKKILKKTNISLTYKIKENNNIITKNGFEVTDNLINFNGKDDDSHETFYFTRVALPETFTSEDRQRPSFNFCKTEYKPYDILVVACLILAKYYFENNIKIESDGDINDWENGRKLIEKYLNYEVKIIGPKIEKVKIKIQNNCTQTEIEEIFGKDNIEEIQNTKDTKDTENMENTENTENIPIDYMLDKEFINL